MSKIYLLIFCLHFSSTAFPQQVKLLKSTVSSSGSSTKYGGRYSVNHSIGQSSLINRFHSKSIHLLQGFQHPFFYDLNGELSTTNKFSVYPNPSAGKVSILWDGEAVTEQLDVSLFDLQGKVVDKMLQLRNGNKIEVDFNKVTNGAYVLVVRGEKSGVSKALLVLN
jgi:hypothetical protein